MMYTKDLCCDFECVILNTCYHSRCIGDNCYYDSFCIVCKHNGDCEKDLFERLKDSRKGE